jgi:hypothetical protein
MKKPRIFGAASEEAISRASSPSRPRMGQQTSKQGRVSVHARSSTYQVPGLSTGEG